jgi:hypothetical protein
MTALDLSFEGRLEVHPYVNEAKYRRMSQLVADSLRGGFDGERAALEARESLAARDGAFSLAHLITARNLPEFDAAERQWTKIASVETVDDFEPTTFQRFAADFSGLEAGKGTKGHQVSPRVAELGTYTYAYGYTEEAVRAAIEKRGFKFGLSLEKLIGNFRRYIRTLPDDMLQVALDTDEFLVFDRLQTSAAPGNRLAAGVDPVTGDVIPANATVSAAAIAEGLRQISRRVVDGKKVPLASSYYVVVATGEAEAVEDDLRRARSVIQIQDGTVVYGPPDNTKLGRIAGVIESEFIEEDGRWFLTPAAGSTRRPGLVKLQLAGRTAPEVLVNNFTGSPIRGGNGSSPFDLAHFDNDSVDLKLRQFTNSAQITQYQMIWSDGTSS